MAISIELISMILLQCFSITFAQWEDLDSYLTLQEEEALLSYHMNRLRVGMDPGPFADRMMLRKKQLPTYKDYLTIENPLKRVKDNHTLIVKYQCKKPSTIIVFIGGDHLNLVKHNLNRTIQLYTDADVIFFRKQWECTPSPYEAKATFQVKFPPELIQKPGILYPKVWTMENVKLKMAMVEKESWDYLVSAQKKALRDIFEIAYERSERTVMLNLKLDHPYCRSEKSLQRCYTWPYQIFDSIYRETPPVSHPDQMAISLLPHPVIASSETTGVPRNFIATSNPEVNQISPLKRPRMTISITFYMASKCTNLCALFQHIDETENFGSPIIYLRDDDQLYVQAKLSNNNSYVVRSELKVPVREWIRMDIQQLGSLVNITMRHGENFAESKSTVRTYALPVIHDYRKGYYVAGPSLHSRGIEGIIGSLKMWRNMIVTSDEIHTDLDHEMFEIGKPIEAFLEKTDDVLQMIDRRWKYLQGSNETSSIRTDICVPYFLEIIQPPKKEDQTPVSSQPLSKQYKHIETQLVKIGRKRRSKKAMDIYRIVGQRIYKRALKAMGDDNRIHNMGPVIDILENSAALFHGPSLFLLYVIYENGFGIKTDRKKAQTYIRLGAMVGDRMCIKAMATKYFFGKDGFPEDLEIAYWYFINAASRAQVDRQIHEEGMVEVNRVRLTDEREMKSQTAEDEDLFEWFKHQANTGVTEAKRNFAQFLYWGKQGLKRNLKAAFEYYEKAVAEKPDDPETLYDYGITLMKGHGTEKNEEKALEALEQAAAKDSPSAHNTLGWYYIKKKETKEKAVQYFEKASELNSIDATYNLGHMHYIGDYPGQERDLAKAFQFFYKAATQGHVQSCVRVSFMFATGIENFLMRNIRNACAWAHPVADMSPVMGELLREALQAYRARAWTKSALLYLAAADSGFEPAMFNTAYLCHDGQDKELRENINKDCVWRFWNESANYHYDTPAYAQNKMGDYYYYGIDGEPDLDKAILYYVEAAKKREAQALFNLAFILEKHGDVIKNSTLFALRIPVTALKRREDTILELYQKCSRLNTEANSMPCYMGYLRMQAIVMWKYTPLTSKIAFTLLAVGISTLLIFASSLLRHSRRTDELVLSEQGSAEDDPFRTIRTHILHEEVIENELSRQNSRNEREDAEDNVDFTSPIQTENSPAEVVHDEYESDEAALEVSEELSVEVGDQISQNVEDQSESDQKTNSCVQDECEESKKCV